MTPEREQEIRDWLAADQYTGLPDPAYQDVCRELQAQREEARRAKETAEEDCDDWLNRAHAERHERDLAETRAEAFGEALQRIAKVTFADYNLSAQVMRGIAREALAAAEGEAETA